MAPAAPWRRRGPPPPRRAAPHRALERGAPNTHELVFLTMWSRYSICTWKVTPRVGFIPNLYISVCEWPMAVPQSGISDLLQRLELRLSVADVHLLVQRAAA
jgi:hypothetical protein